MVGQAGVNLPLILLLAILAGLLASGLRAWINKQTLAIPRLRMIWLVVVAFIPQLILFYLPVFHIQVPRTAVAAALVVSQAGLLFFALANLRIPGFWLLSLGLSLNFLAIALNGGLMPISPETITRLIPEALPGSWVIGERLGTGKDIVLPVGVTRLVWLSDRFILPLAPPFRVAFSIGDVFLAAGVFWALWMLSRKELNHKRRNQPYVHDQLTIT
jgi:hypothetical protein